MKPLLSAATLLMVSAGLAQPSLPTSAMSESMVCPQCDLAGHDYSGQMLSAPNFAGADLRGANFEGATINGGNFIGADLTDATFAYSIIDSDAEAQRTPTLFQDARLSRTIFTNATLKAADFQYASMSCVSFEGVDLAKAVFGPYPNIDDGSDCTTSFRNATLTCELTGLEDSSNTEGVKLQDCTPDYPDGVNLAEPLVSLATDPRDPTPGGVSNTISRSVYRGPPADRRVLSGAAAAQTVHVSPQGTDRAGCGDSVPNACRTIALAIAQCSSRDCLVAAEYGTYTPETSIKVAKGGVTVAGGFVNGQPVQDYQSQVIAPPGGLPAFDLGKTDSGVVLRSLLIVGTTPPKASAGSASAPSIAVRAIDSDLTLDQVTVTAGTGVAGAGGTTGTIGASGGRGGTPTNHDPGGAGGSSACGAPGGIGGRSSSSVSSHMTGYLVCKVDCNVTWYGGSPGMPGSTGYYAPGTTLTKNDGDLICYALPSKHGEPKTPATGSAGRHGTCGSGGAASPDTKGHFDVSGSWTASPGGRGTRGGAGGGGGGGGPGGTCGYANLVCDKHNYTGGAGGGGGGGGCGATPGSGGSAGGAAFGVVISAGTLHVSSDTVITGGLSGGGGPGAASVLGGAGGKGGKGKSGSGCSGGGASGASGGTGGQGGSAGASAGGNAGPAINVALVNGAKLSGAPVYYQGRSGSGGAAGAQPSGGPCIPSPAASGTAGTIATVQTY